MPPVQYRSQVMDHLGLVAGMCKELGIVEHIDKRAPKLSDEWNISHGEAVIATAIPAVLTSPCLPRLRGLTFDFKSAI